MVRELQKRAGLTVIVTEDAVGTALEIRHLWPNEKSAHFAREAAAEMVEPTGAVFERVLHDGTIGRLGPDGATFTRPEVG
jgi:hypothetical protein